ncbi:Crp/Fnr family transcriptional regulator [Facklamia hominis]|uniref:Crp/Fnr family transcriptional regulator n=1 Tax=Facklamia hominis TaxID=178214 RepID=UPI000C795DEA|nr:Crp/Fnr family transcriptional regulator [Facklamia hominis]PKY92720.1 Crp/Fnr family transcriptional regulator [Facklamia hominis]
MVNRDLERYVEQLEDYEFFSRLTLEQANQITSSALFHHISKGQYIFFREDPIIYFYFNFKGLVRLEREDASGDYRYLDYVGEESFFPYAEFMNRSEHIYDAIAVTDVDLFYIPKKLMEDIVRSNSEQLAYVYSNLTDIQYYLEKRVQMTAIPSATMRVIQTLAIWMYDMGKFMPDHVIIPHPLTIMELASVAGTTRETAGKVVKELREEGKLDFTRQNIIYKDWKYFSKLLE